MNNLTIQNNNNITTGSTTIKEKDSKISIASIASIALNKTSMKSEKRKKHRREQTIWLDSNLFTQNPNDGKDTKEEEEKKNNQKNQKNEKNVKKNDSLVVIDDIALNELRMVAREVLDRQIESVIVAALNEDGKVTGVVGGLNILNIDIEPLEQALDIVDDIMKKR